MRARNATPRTVLGLRACAHRGWGVRSWRAAVASEQIASGGLDDIVSIHNAKQKSQGMVGAVGMRAAIELCGHNSYIAASRFLDPYRWEREIARARDLRIIGRNAGAGHT